MNVFWAAACGGWVLGMLQGAAIAYIVLTYHRRKGGVTMLRSKTNQLGRWVARNFTAVALIIIVISNSFGWFVTLKLTAENDRQNTAITAVATCTGKYLAKDAQARDARSDAVKPRDDAEAAFIRAVASLRENNGSNPAADRKRAAAIFAATDAFEKATAELNKIRAVDYPTYTCDKDR